LKYRPINLYEIVFNKKFKTDNMKEFLLIFRGDYIHMPTGTPEERKAITQKWMDWIASIADQNKLASRGNRLENTGRVLKGNLTTDGPFCETKEIVGGYTLIKAASLDEAETIAKGCPILSLGGSVEVREISVLS
jgi:hypothetical protein